MRHSPETPYSPKMYVCGPTVYDRAHIGNARSAVVFDLLFRLLREVYGAENVTFVRNITDIDDKINARADRDRTPHRRDHRRDRAVVFRRYRSARRVATDP